MKQRQHFLKQIGKYRIHSVPFSVMSFKKASILQKMLKYKPFSQKKIKSVKKKKDFFETGRISIISKYFLQNKKWREE